MNTLATKFLNSTRAYLFSECSTLLQQRWIHAFETPNYAGVVKALSAYQNPDGGFGNNLEGDFMLPDSSPLATSIGLQILTNLGAGSSEPLVQRAIAYLLKNYQPERPGWFTVPPDVNDYPHASWWHYHSETGDTVIDRNWGNPTAELTGYLMQYRALAPSDVLDPILAYTLNYLHDFKGPMEMHELYCFLSFAVRLPASEFTTIQPRLIELVRQAVALNPADWIGYSAQPLDFVKSPDSFLYPSLVDAVQTNLDYLIATISSQGVYTVPWSWQDYPAEWESVLPEITGRIALERLVLLKRFGRIE